MVSGDGDLASLGRTCHRLLGVCELITRKKFHHLEKLANNPDLSTTIPAAQLILINAIADGHLCTPHCADALDNFSAYLNGRPALMTCHNATNGYLRRYRAIAHSNYAGNEKMIRFFYTTLYLKVLKAFDTIQCVESFVTPDRLRMEFVIEGAWMGILWTSRGGKNTFRFPQESIVLFNILSSLATGAQADIHYTVLQGYVVTDRVVAYGYLAKKSRPSGPKARQIKPLYITVTLDGNPEWLKAIQDGIYQPPINEFKMEIFIDSKLAESRGCPKSYTFTIEPKLHSSSSDTDMERYDEQGNSDKRSNPRNCPAKRMRRQ